MGDAQTIFLSAATVDLKRWRDVLHEAFSRAGFRVLTQDHSLGAAPGTVKRLLADTVDESDCIIHLAGMGYGSDAADPFPADATGFRCSWTQFEYYHAHEKGKDVIAFVCAPDLSQPGFTEAGNADDIARKYRLQQEHRDRVASGKFDGTPLAGKDRTSNEQVESAEKLLAAVAAAVGKLHKLDKDACAKAQTELHDLAAALGRVEAGVGTAKEKLDKVLAILRGERAAINTLHTLPLPPEGFVGRESDLADLRKLNPAAGALLTGLRGMGGIGKTALALVLAHEWSPRFPDAQIFLDARGTQKNPPSAGDLLARVIQAFHPTAKLPEEESALKGIYHDLLGGKKVLILLDNAKDAAQAAPLIPPAGCALIVTSRHGFMLGKTPPHLVGRLPDGDAVALLREYHPALDDAHAAAIVKLCAGLPLALRLAGAHLALDAGERGGTPDVAGYVKALGSGRLRHLDADAADAGVIAISETLRLSEAQLDEPQRDAWRKLGVFTADFDARAAEVIAGVDEAMLGQFVRRSLLEREGAERYKLHDLAADYARGQIPAAARDALKLAHARHYTDVASEADATYQTKGKAVDGLALFDRERAQMEAAYASLAGRAGAARQMIALVDAVLYTCDLRFHPRQRIAWLESQLRAARLAKDRRSEGNALGNLGTAHYSLGDARKAIEFYEQDLAIAHENGDRRSEGTTLGNLGIAYAALGDARKAIEFYEQDLAIVREFGNRRGEGSVLGNLGNAHFGLGDARKAIEFHEQALVVLGEIGNRRGEGSVLGNLGNAHCGLGDARKAIEFYEQYLAIAREIGDRRAEGSALCNLGGAHADLGDASEAIEFYEQALVIDREIGDRRGEGIALWNSALAHESLGNRAEAIARAAAALAIREAIEDPNAAKVRAKLAEWRGA